MMTFISTSFWGKDFPMESASRTLLTAAGASGLTEDWGQEGWCMMMLFTQQPEKKYKAEKL